MYSEIFEKYHDRRRQEFGFFLQTPVLYGHRRLKNAHEIRRTISASKRMEHTNSPSLDSF